MLCLVPQISRHMKCLVDETPELQYKLKLFLTGMKEVGPRQVDVLTALTQLQIQQDTQRKVTFTDEEKIPHVANGIYREFDMSRNLLIQQNGPGSLTCHQLSPEPLWGLPKCWRIELDFTARNFRASPEDDLLIVSESGYVFFLHCVPMEGRVNSSPQDEQNPPSDSQFRAATPLFRDSCSISPLRRRRVFSYDRR